MMGERTVMQEELFYGFSLERHVPADHLLRAIDRFVDLSSHPPTSGPLLQPDRPPLHRPRAADPHADRRLLLRHPLGAPAMRGSPSESGLSLVLPPGLEGDVPDHSTFSKTRHGRFRDADLLRQLFETVVRRCIAEGSRRRRRLCCRCQHDRRRCPSPTRVETADDLNPAAKRAVAEYLATLDDAAFGAATPVEPKFISPVDPAARWTASWGGPAVYAYCTNYLIDVEHAIIVDVEPSTAVRQAEMTAAKTMIERIHERSRSLARAPDCRHRLRLGRDAQLAGA